MTMTMAATTTDDPELLLRYADERTEEAFAELVRRHLDLVHSAALRQVGGNEASAADVAQAVFTELARQAGRLTRHPALTGWLYTTTHRMAARHVRGETRRQRREQEAHAMQELHRDAEPELDWARLRPVLDAAMHDLGETDRLAVLLRHFEQRPLAEVGTRLGLSENAARMRVDRALEKLRAKLAKRGVTSTASALALALTGQAVTAAPATLAATITTAALAATFTTSSTLGILTLMASTKLKITVAVAVLATAGGALVLQSQTAARLRADNAELLRRVAELTDDAQSLRQTAARNAEALSRANHPSADLLRLRSEVGQLRQQLAAAREPAVAAKADGQMHIKTEEEQADEDRHAFAVRRSSEAKTLMLGFHLYSNDHADRFPDSLETAVTHLKSSSPSPEMEATLKNLRTDDFEQMFKGSITNIADPASAIVVREREAWQDPKGRWLRIYGFADGHSEIVRIDDGDFTAWEAEHQVRPASGDLPGAAAK